LLTRQRVAWLGNKDIDYADANCSPAMTGSAVWSCAFPQIPC